MLHYYENPDGLSAADILALDVKKGDKGELLPAGVIAGVRVQGDSQRVAEVLFFGDVSEAGIAECAAKLDKSGLRLLDRKKSDSAPRRKAKAPAQPVPVATIPAPELPGDSQ